MIVIRDKKRGGYLGPVTRYNGSILPNKVYCSPFPRDFKTRSHATAVVSEVLRIPKFKNCDFEVVQI